MKKLFFLVKVLVLSTCVLTLTTACGDDEEITPEVINSDASKLVDLDGNPYRLYGYDYNTYTYNEDGQLIGWTFGGHYDDWAVQYKGGKYVFTRQVGDEGVETTEMSFSLNKNGYVTNAYIEATEDYGENSKDNQQSSISFTYDSAGQLTGYKGSVKAIEEEDGDKSTANVDFNCTFTWKNGNMEKAVYKGTLKISGTEDGEKFNYTSKVTETHEYEYGSVPNPLRQMPWCLTRPFEIDDVTDGAMEELPMTGIFGKGPSYLPVKRTRISEEIEDGDEIDRDTYTYDVNIKLNANGTIATENGNKYYYSPVARSSQSGKTVKAGNHQRGIKRMLSRHGHLKVK